MEFKKVEETDGSTPVVNLTFTYVDEPFIKEFPRYFKNNLFQAVWKEHIQLHKDGKLISIETVDDDQCDTASSNKDITNGKEITKSETDESETDNSILSNEGITNHQDEETTESKTVSEIEHINSYFWDPVISKCKVLITGVQDCSISLSVVIKYFGNYEERNSFIQLANPLAEKIDTFSAEKFTAGIERIISYKSFLNCKDVANAFLNMKKMLKLTGNFESFESISNPVSCNITPRLFLMINCDSVIL